jgi:hypothetical protein
VASRSEPTDRELGAWLADLGAHLDAASPPDLAAGVRRRLEAAPERAPVPRPARRRLPWLVARTPRLALVGALLVVLLTTTLTFSPATRRAVAGWLGLRGVRVEQRDIALPPPGARLHLGARVGLRAADRLMGFRVLTLPEARFGRPDGVFVASGANGRRVTVLYAPRAGLPGAGPGVGALLTQFRAGVDDEYVRKVVASGGAITAVTVDGGRGYWVQGVHAMWFTDANGRPFEDGPRLAGNTLIWERGPLTLRLESALSRAEALRLARSL